MFTIYHNPSCSTSRKVLDALRAAGIAPQVIDYRKTGWTRAQLSALLAAAGLTPRQALRAATAPAPELGLATASDAAILDAMLAHPQLVERPFVTGPRGTLLCRPPERVQELIAAT